MKTLVAYLSQTGNTKKVAEAIYAAVEGDKEIKPVKEVRDLEGYDLAFLGFPVLNQGLAPQARRFLESATPGKRVALFITHAAPQDAPELPATLDKFRNACAGADVVGLFDCRGQLGKMVKAMMRVMPDPKLRHWAKIDDSQGYPDAASLGRAAAWAQETMARSSRT